MTPYTTSCAYLRGVARNIADEMERTGVNPETGRKVSGDRARQAIEQARQEAARADEMAQGVIDSNANIYGDEAAKAFQRYAEEDIQKETPRGQPQRLSNVAAGAAETAARGPESRVAPAEPVAAERTQAKPVFVVDPKGSIARVVNWQGNQPVVVYPGNEGGKRPGTAQQGGRAYQYILDEWKAATEGDFSKTILPSGNQRMIDLRQWRDEFTAGGKREPGLPPTKVVYTSIPDQWRQERELYSWGKKGLRARGNRAIAGRKTFVWQSECEPLPTRLPKSTMDALRAKTDETWKVHNRGGEDYWLVPKRAAEEVRNQLGPEAFQRGPKPERSPLQKLNDLINSGRRHQATDAEIGEMVDSFVRELGLTEDQLSDRQKAYIKAHHDEKRNEPQRVSETVQPGVGEEIRDGSAAEATAEAGADEERAALQAEDSAGEIGDFLEGLLDETENPTPQADTGIFGQEIFRPATGSKQAELPDGGKEVDRREPERPLFGQQDKVTPEIRHVEAQMAKTTEPPQPVDTDTSPTVESPIEEQRNEPAAEQPGIGTSGHRPRSAVPSQEAPAEPLQVPGEQGSGDAVRPASPGAGGELHGEGGRGRETSDETQEIIRETWISLPDVDQPQDATITPVDSLTTE